MHWKITDIPYKHKILDIYKSSDSLKPGMIQQISFYKRLYLRIFRKKGSEGEREGEKH